MSSYNYKLNTSSVASNITFDQDGLKVVYNDGTYATICANSDYATVATVTDSIATKLDIAEFIPLVNRVTELEEKHKEPEVPMETKSILKHNGSRVEVTNFKDGKSISTKYIMPDIKDITVYNNNTVVVEFVDGTKEKAVLSEEDSFSLEQGVSICLAKKLVGGSSIYNKLIDYMLRKYAQIQKKKADEAAELKAKKERARKYKEKKAAKKAAKREEYVRTMQEAFSRALAEHDKCEEQACRSEE